MDAINVSFDRVFTHKDNPAESLADEVIVYDQEFLTGKQLLNPAVTPPIRFDSPVFFLCRYGEISFSVDYKTYHLTKGSLLALNNRHIVDKIYISSNCEAFGLLVSHKLMMSIINDTPVVNKMLKISRGFSEPLLQLEDDEIRDLADIVVRIKKYLKKPGHAFQNHIIRNEVSNFIMEIAGMVMQKQNIPDKAKDKESRKDEVMNNFIRLIVDHFKEQHEVVFYAKELYMTPANLSRTVMAASGRPPLQWISNALVAEAKTLLRKPDSNIKQVSEELHFSDQSSFGKFFKKHTGLTPIQYKNGIW